MDFPIIDMAIVAPMLTLFGWATALLLVDLFFVPEDNKRVTGYLAIAGLVATAVVAFVAGARDIQPVASAPFSGMVVMDNFALTLTWIFLLVGIISIAISLDYLPRHGIEQGEYYPLMMFATGGMVVLAQATDLIMLFMGVELLSITLYILTAFFYPRLASEEAAMKYLLLGAFAAGFLVFGVALIYGQTQTVNLLAMSEQVRLSGTGDNMLLLIGGALVLVAFGFKIALAPFHMWTPDVYEGAPTPVTAFMSVGTKGAALAAMLRILILALPAFQEYWMPILGVLAVLTMIIGNVGALAQQNVKRMLAYSSIGHAGYIVLGILAINNHGTEAFLFYLIAYALTNLGAFAVIIALEQRGETAWSLDDFSGLAKRQIGLAVAMAIFMLSLAGVPPTAGFFAKFSIFAAAWESGMTSLVIIGVLTSAVAAFFYLRIIVRMFMVEPVRDIQPVVYRGAAISIVVTAVGTVLFGLIPTPVVDLVQKSVIVAVGG